MKICKNCGTKFEKVCRKCANESQRRFRKRHKKEMNELVWKIKNSRVCVVCEQSYHPVSMDFHHRDPKIKRFSLTRAYMNSKRLVLEEIEKCDLYCANCHRVLHWEKIQKEKKNGKL